jgi:putative ABC transport system permease protein
MVASRCPPGTGWCLRGPDQAGVVLLYALLIVLRPLIDARFGLYIDLRPPAPRELAMLAIVVVGGLLAGLLPALRAYRLSLADGMTIRV